MGKVPRLLWREYDMSYAVFVRLQIGVIDNYIKVLAPDFKDTSVNTWRFAGFGGAPIEFCQRKPSW